MREAPDGSFTQLPPPDKKELHKVGNEILRKDALRTTKRHASHEGLRKNKKTAAGIAAERKHKADVAAEANHKAAAKVKEKSEKEARMAVRELRTKNQLQRMKDSLEQRSEKRNKNVTRSGHESAQKEVRHAKQAAKRELEVVHKHGEKELKTSIMGRRAEKSREQRREEAREAIKKKDLRLRISAARAEIEEAADQANATVRRAKAAAREARLEAQARIKAWYDAERNASRVTRERGEAKLSRKEKLLKKISRQLLAGLIKKAKEAAKKVHTKAAVVREVVHTVPANKTVRHNTSSGPLKNEMSQLAKQMQKLKPRHKGVTAATERMEKAAAQQERAEKHLIKYDHAAAATAGAVDPDFR